MARIGIMGGTFDPIHNGHLLLGKQAYSEYHLDEIWYMPSGRPPHKTKRHVSEINDRIAMVCLAIADYSYFKFSDYEIKRPGLTYTAQTLELLNQDYPGNEFFFIIGADSLYEIETWFHPEKVMSLTTLMVSAREYEQADESLEEKIRELQERYQAKIVVLHSPVVKIASSEIRDRVSRGETVKDMIPDPVEDYIEKHNLYKEQ